MSEYDGEFLVFEIVRVDEFEHGVTEQKRVWANCLNLVASRASLIQFPAEGVLMGKLQGLVAIVSELRVERANLVNQLKHVDAALSVLGKLTGGTSFTEPERIGRKDY